MLFLVVLIVSLMINIWKFAQPAQVVQLPGYGAMPAAAGGNRTLPNGQPDPLLHVPQNPQDAVGMPDATGGRQTPGQ